MADRQPICGSTGRQETLPISLAMVGFGPFEILGPFKSQSAARFSGLLKNGCIPSECLCVSLEVLKKGQITPDSCDSREP